MPSPLLPLIALGLTLLAAALPADAPAQGYPSRPVRLIVTSAPGVVTDLNARLIAGKLATTWGQPVVVDNRPGNPVIGTEALVKSAPDGHTLLLTNTSIAQNPAIRGKDLPYDALRDIAPITQTFVIRIVYAIDAKLPAPGMREFLELARQSPGRINFGSYGTGSTAHMLAAKLNHDAQVDIVHVPYNGPAPAIRALLASDVSAVMADIASIRPHVASGRARILAATGARRSPFLPDVPTFEESGVQGFAVDSWAGLFAPAGTPEPVLESIAAEVAKITALPDVQAWYRDATVEAVTNTPARFREIVRDDIAYWTRLVRTTGVKVN